MGAEALIVRERLDLLPSNPDRGFTISSPGFALASNQEKRKMPPSMTIPVLAGMAEIRKSWAGLQSHAARPIQTEL